MLSGLPTRVNVQNCGVLPSNAPQVNDAALLRLIDSMPNAQDGRTNLDLYFPASRDDYKIYTSLNPDNGGLTLSGDGPSSRLTMYGRPDPIVMFGMGKRPGGVPFDPAVHRVPTRLDSSAASGRYAYRTNNDSHMVQACGHLASTRWEQLSRLRIEYIYDSTGDAPLTQSAPIFGIDGCWYVYDGPAWGIWFWTTDNGANPTMQAIGFRAPEPGWHHLTVQLDLDRPGPPWMIYRDGVQLTVAGGWTDPAPGVVRRLVPNPGKTFGVGVVSRSWITPYSLAFGNVNRDHRIHGLACYGDNVYADGPGQPQRRLDGRPITDSNRCWDLSNPSLIGTLMLTDTPADMINRRMTIAGHGGIAAPDWTSSGFLVSREHERDGLGGFTIERLTLSSPGDALAIGQALNTNYRGSSFNAGPGGRALATWPGGANYVHTVENCNLSAGEANLFASTGTWYLRNCQVGIIGRNAFWGVDSALTLRDIWTTGFGQPERIGYFQGCVKVILDNLSCDIENGQYPSQAMIEAQTSANMGGYTEQVILRDLGLGAGKPGTAILRLGTVAGQPVMAARIMLSGLQLAAGAHLMTMVQVDSPGWFGQVEISDDLQGKEPIVASFPGICNVEVIQPTRPPNPA